MLASYVEDGWTGGGDQDSGEDESEDLPSRSEDDPAALTDP